VNIELESVRALAAEYDMLPAGGTVLCAVSGGADSMCLLHLLWSEGETGGWTVAAAHYNHHLRGEDSDRDAAFVRDWCRERNIPVYLGQGDVAAEAEQRGQGIEETARQLRYAFLTETAEKIGACRVATAHTADDNGETLLLHLVRGTGLQGLTGIPPRRGDLVRPLLTTSRAEIEDYLAAHDIPHVEDATNADPAYRRNFLRHQVMPLLREINPNLTMSLSATAQSLRTDNDYLNAQAARAFAGIQRGPEGVVISNRVLAGLPPALAFRVIQRMAEAAGSGVVLSRVHRESVLRLAQGSASTGQLDLPGGLTALRVYGDLVLTRGNTVLPPLTARILSLPGQAALPELNAVLMAEAVPEAAPNASDSLYLASDRVGTGLVIRPRRTGDVLGLVHREGHKTLKKWMIEQKIPRQLRERVPVVEVNGQVAAVFGLGVDRAFAPSPGQTAWKLTLTGQKDPDGVK
jgi:tRNA(Ile)-lysidine synthase